MQRLAGQPYRRHQREQDRVGAGHPFQPRNRLPLSRVRSLAWCSGARLPVRYRAGFAGSGRPARRCNNSRPGSSTRYASRIPAASSGRFCSTSQQMAWVKVSVFERKGRGVAGLHVAQAPVSRRGRWRAGACRCPRRRSNWLSSCILAPVPQPISRSFESGSKVGAEHLVHDGHHAGMPPVGGFQVIHDVVFARLHTKMVTCCRCAIGKVTGRWRITRYWPSEFDFNSASFLTSSG